MATSDNPTQEAADRPMGERADLGLTSTTRQAGRRATPRVQVASFQFVPPVQDSSIASYPARQACLYLGVKRSQGFARARPRQRCRPGPTRIRLQDALKYVVPNVHALGKGVQSEVWRLPGLTLPVASACFLYHNTLEVFICVFSSA